ncbi:actin-depolymerizing factor 5 [Musa troglodytarum]|uniref:Actin-depolymerizing factor 5 n=1 Tax=Musa troglodytarum TaxID=320322 RepID=A0A9E7KLQ1_9LILI|nr:actin-depolymerizing factor 5 [Musa troglodytarum]
MTPKAGKPRRGGLKAGIDASSRLLLQPMAMAFKMATEGMRVRQECLSSFTEMKWKRASRYVVYRIDEKSREVTVDKVGSPGDGYDGLAASLPLDDCRYAVFDFDFVTVDNCRKSKIFFIAWLTSLSKPYVEFDGDGRPPDRKNRACPLSVEGLDVSVRVCESKRRSPTASRIRSKMLYATSKQGLTRLLEGIHYEVQATDAAEMGLDVIKERAK